MLGINRSDQRTSGIGSAEATDHSRRLHNLIRYGVVAEIDHTTGTLRADLQDGQLRSDWIPWVSMRAGQDQVWDPPGVGEVVLLLSSSGELGNAVALPAVFSEGNQNGDRAGLHRRTYQDGTVVEYDRQSHTLTVDTTASTGSTVVVRTGGVSIEANGTVDIQSQGLLHIHTLGDVLLEADGAVTVDADGPVSITGSQVHLNPSA